VTCTVVFNSGVCVDICDNNANVLLNELTLLIVTVIVCPITIKLPALDISTKFPVELSRYNKVTGGVNCDRSMVNNNGAVLVLCPYLWDYYRYNFQVVDLL